MATKKRRKPLIHHVGVDVNVPPTTPIEYAPGVMPPEEYANAKPLPSPLLPSKWWEREGHAAIDYGPRPTVVVSPQVAEVLNIGIDRVVDMLKATDDVLRRTQDRTRKVDQHYSRVLEFLRNVRAGMNITEGEQIIVSDGAWFREVQTSIDSILADERP